MNPATGLVTQVLTSCSKPFLILDMDWQLVYWGTFGRPFRECPLLRRAWAGMEDVVRVRSGKIVGEGDIEGQIDGRGLGAGLQADVRGRLCSSHGVGHVMRHSRHAAA
jgi:hypothetical protein